jgi:hypothetical protein
VTWLLLCGMLCLPQLLYMHALANNGRLAKFTPCRSPSWRTAIVREAYHCLLAGYVMWFGLLLGYPFATYWPRMAKCIRGTAIGRFLNNFTNFSITHIAMWIIFYVALILHPYPGTPSQHKNGRSTTWVRLSSLLTNTCAQHIRETVHAKPAFPTCTKCGLTAGVTTLSCSCTAAYRWCCTLPSAYGACCAMWPSRYESTLLT